MREKSLQSCPTICDPMDCSPQGPSVHGIFQARILERVAIPFSRGSSPTQGSNLCLLSLLRWQAGSSPLVLPGKPLSPHIRHETLTSGYHWYFSSVQLLSHVRLFATPSHSTPGLPVHYHLPEFTQTLVHQVGDAIQPSHPLSSQPSPPALSSSWHQGLSQ